MNVDAIWHDLECGGYSEDFGLWHALVGRTGGPVLDVGAGTGRVTLELAASGVNVVALDVAAPLVSALECRAAELPVETVVADAREFRLDRRFALIVVPMQTLQLFGGRAGRAAFLHSALVHLKGGGLLAAAVADAMDCFDDEHALLPPPQGREVLGVRFTSQLLGVVEHNGRAAIHRLREIVPACGPRESQESVVQLDRVSVAEIVTEARQVGFIAEPSLYIPETDQYLGSTVVVLRAP